MFTNGCTGKMLFAIFLAIAGVLCGMVPYFAIAGLLTEIFQETLTLHHIFGYVG